MHTHSQSQQQQPELQLVQHCMAQLLMVLQILMALFARLLTDSLQTPATLQHYLQQ
jgi:hypothetical protein